MGWTIAVVALAVPIALYFWPDPDGHELETQTVARPTPEPTIRFPVASEEQAARLLPALADSDAVFGDELIALFGKRIGTLVNLDSIIHRVVATVDNLPRDQVSQRVLPLKPVKGRPVVTTTSEGFALNAKNATRYTPYLRLLETVPSQALVGLYLRFYPLFQQQYENLGYPDSYFNDRVVQVIDHLLATPEVEEPVRLIQPSVLYEFEDVYLEGLSAGQKLLLRVGPANRLSLKLKLREIREALTSNAAQ
jgi:hypothetical protein